MGKLLVKMIGFCIVVILITNWSISQVNVLRYTNFGPCSVNHIHKNLSDYNVLFVGSSRFGRQIDTELFDSMNTNLNFHSYNYSFDAAFAPTSLNLANSVLAQRNNNLKVLILELTPIEFAGELDPGFVTRSINWYSFNDFLFLLQSESGVAMGFFNRVCLALHRVYLFAHRTLSVGEFWKRVVMSKESCSSANSSTNPLPEIKKTPELLRELNEIRAANTTEKLASYNLDLSSSSYLHALNKLNEECRKRNIELITVVAPRLGSVGITYVESLAKLLNQETVLRLNDADEYAQLYGTALTSDPGHLNEKGIRLFTEYVSAGVQHILQQKTEEKNEIGNL